MKDILLKDDNGRILFFIEQVNNTSASNFNFFVTEVTSWLDNDEPADETPYVNGSMKYDGDCHFYFGDDGYSYLAGLAYIKQHLKVVEALYKFIQVRIEKFDETELWK